MYMCFRGIMFGAVPFPSKHHNLNSDIPHGIPHINICHMCDFKKFKNPVATDLILFTPPVDFKF